MMRDTIKVAGTLLSARAGGEVPRGDPRFW